MNGRNQPWRAIAARVLQGVENGQSLSQSLPPALTQVAPEQRPQLQAVCYGSCRWYHRLDAELRDRLSKPLRKPDRIIHQLMLVALFQLRCYATASSPATQYSTKPWRPAGHSTSRT